ncbi:MAG: 5'-nucleotidase [Bacteroidota bacterium]
MPQTPTPRPHSPFLIPATLLAALLFYAGCKPALHRQSVSPQNISIGYDAPVDTAVDNFIAPYRNSMAAEMNRVLGSNAQVLEKNVEESTLGNFAADMLLEEARRITGNNTPDMAAVTNGGLRVNLPAGPILVSNIFEYCPFENELVILTLKGGDVYRMFKYMGAGKNLTLANTTAIFINGKLQLATIGGQGLDTMRTYTLATSDYLAEGGDRMSMLPNAIARKNTGMKIRELTMEHISRLTAAGKQITVKKDGRMQFHTE